MQYYDSHSLRDRIIYFTLINVLGKLFIIITTNTFSIVFKQFEVIMDKVEK